MFFGDVCSVSSPGCQCRPNCEVLLRVEAAVEPTWTRQLISESHCTAMLCEPTSFLALASPPLLTCANIVQPNPIEPWQTWSVACPDVGQPGTSRLATFPGLHHKGGLIQDSPFSSFSTSALTSACLVVCHNLFLDLWQQVSHRTHRLSQGSLRS